MTKIHFDKRYIIWILFVFILLGGLSLASFYASKLSAEKLVGDSLANFPLTKTMIAIEPFKRNQLVWLFKFSHPGSFDEDFYIYTTLWGNIALTNPKDLKERLKIMRR
jgi:hypothetical protein